MIARKGAERRPGVALLCAAALVALPAPPFSRASARAPARFRAVALGRSTTRAAWMGAEQPASPTELVLRIVRHDVTELRLALTVEAERFGRTIRRVTLDELERHVSLLGGLGRPKRADAARARVGTLGGRRRAVLPAAAERGAPARCGALRFSPARAESCAAGRRDGSSPGASSGFDACVAAMVERGVRARASFARIARVLVAQRARVSALLGSYMHWRAPLLCYWLVSSASAKLEPLHPLLSPLARLCAPTLAPTLARIATSLAHARVRLPSTPPPGARGAGTPRAPRRGGGGRRGAIGAARAARWEKRGAAFAFELHAAIVHLVPQIVAKLRHATFHEPAALGLFLVVALRLLLLLPLLRISYSFDAHARTGGWLDALRAGLCRRILLDATLASERCNRVEVRRSLAPLAPPGNWRTSLGDEMRAAAAAIVAHGAHALAQFGGWQTGLMRGGPSAYADAEASRLASRRAAHAR